MATLSQAAPSLSRLKHKDEYKYTVGLKPRNSFVAKYYLIDSERAQLISETSVSALVLFEYYLRLACNGKHQPELSDRKASADLGFNANTVRRLRSDLTKAGWVKIVRTPRNNNTGHKGFFCYLGKSAVVMNS